MSGKGEVESRKASFDDTEDEAERASRNRERNKEHARKTRLRKKEQLQALKARVTELEEEGKRLKQEIEACNVASILVGLSSGNVADEADELKNPVSSSTTNFGASLSGGKRKRFMSIDGEDSNPPPMELNIKGQITLVGGSGNDSKTQINWKTGVYCDENGNRQQLTQSELETLRRERNRMHAKMTRDRKKCYVASIKRVITKLEEENQRLRETLVKSKSLARRDSFDQDSMTISNPPPYASSTIHPGSQPKDFSSSNRPPMLNSAIHSNKETSKPGSRPSAYKPAKLDSNIFSRQKSKQSGNGKSSNQSMFSSSIYTVG